jgi:hypothetical protein
MWVNKMLFEMILADNKRMATDNASERIGSARMSASLTELRTQKAKDDISIDWMRHRINALEKLNAQLLAKAAGVHVPIPEIVPTRPGTISDGPAAFDQMPSFEDVGDVEAARLGAAHDDEGVLTFTK